MLDEKEVRQTEKSIPLFKRAKQTPVKLVRQLVHISGRALQPRAAVWQRHRRKYRRGLYYLRFDNGRTPLYFTNYIYSIVETIKSNLTRTLPITSVRAKGKESDQVAADILGKAARYELERAGLKRVSQGVVHHGLLTGIGWFKVRFDSDKDSLAVDCIAPEDILVDPLCLYPEDARWLIHIRRNIAVDAVEAETGKKPKLDKSASDGINMSDRGYGSTDKTKATDVSDVVDVYECWIRNYDKNAEADWYVFTVAGDIVVEDLKPNPYEDFPFVPWFDVEDDGAENIYYRGVGEVEEIESLQDKADALDQRIYQNIALTAARQRFVSSQSGLHKDQLDNTPARTYMVNGDPSKAVYYDDPPSLSRDVFEYRRHNDTLIQTVSGVFDVTQGRRPVGITAGRAIQSLQEAAAVRIAFKVDSFAEAIKEVYVRAIKIIIDYYDGERIFKITDADKDVTVTVIDEYPEALQERKEMSDEEKEALMQIREEWKQENGIMLVLSDVNFEWDIDVDPDSALPASRTERGQMAADLFRLGAIDRKALLDMVDFPNRREVLQRLGESVTGKNAGQTEAEAVGTQGHGFDVIAQALFDSGVEPERINQIMEILTQVLQSGGQQPQGRQPQPGQPNPTGNYPAQIEM